MKLKYYLRGMGIGIILTAIVMGFALGGRKASISDAEVIERAKSLGMIDPNSGVLDSGSNGADTNEEQDQVASGETLDQAREEISEKIDEAIAETSEYVSDLAEDVIQGETETESESKTQGNDDSSSGEASNKQEEVASVETKPTSTQDSANSQAEEQNTSPSDENTETVADSSVADASTSANSIVDTVTSESNEASTASSTTSVTKTVTIPSGLSSDQVAAILYREGLVDSSYSFNQYLVDRRMDRTIRSGVKTIPAGSTYEQIASIICK